MLRRRKDFVNVSDSLTFCKPLRLSNINALSGLKWLKTSYITFPPHKYIQPHVNDCVRILWYLYQLVLLLITILPIESICEIDLPFFYMWITISNVNY